MPRPPKPRRVGFIPSVTCFKPSGVPMMQIDEVRIGLDEWEALRLKDYLGLDQEECAKYMNLAQSTFQRVLASARAKVASVIVEGKALRIEGGNYQVDRRRLCRFCGCEWEDPLISEGKMRPLCPSCGMEEINRPGPPYGPGPPPWAGSGRRRQRGR